MMKNSAPLIEYRALGWGVLAGIVVAISHWFLGWVIIRSIGAMQYVNFAQQHWMALNLINCCIYVAHGVAIGAVTAWAARERVYGHAVGAVILMIFLLVLYSFHTFSLLTVLQELGLSVVFKPLNLLKLTGALLGAYMAQSIKRNREIRID